MFREDESVTELLLKSDTFECILLVADDNGDDGDGDDDGYGRVRVG